MTVVASELTAAQYARELAGPGVGVIVSEGQQTLASTLFGALPAAIPAQGNVTIAGVGYRAVTRRFSGFGAPIRVTVLSDVSAPGELGGNEPARGGDLHRRIPAACVRVLGAGIARAAGPDRTIPERRSPAGRRRLLVARPDRGPRRVRRARRRVQQHCPSSWRSRSRSSSRSERGCGSRCSGSGRRSRRTSTAERCSSWRCRPRSTAPRRRAGGSPRARPQISRCRSSVFRIAARLRARRARGGTGGAQVPRRR